MRGCGLGAKSSGGSGRRRRVYSRGAVDRRRWGSRGGGWITAARYCGSGAIAEGWCAKTLHTNPPSRASPPHNKHSRRLPPCRQVPTERSSARRRDEPGFGLWCGCSGGCDCQPLPATAARRQKPKMEVTVDIPAGCSKQRRENARGAPRLKLVRQYQVAV